MFVKVKLTSGQIKGFTSPSTARVLLGSSAFATCVSPRRSDQPVIIWQMCSPIGLCGCGYEQEIDLGIHIARSNLNPDTYV